MESGGNHYSQHQSADYTSVQRRVRACDYLSVAQLFLQGDFLLEHPLTPEDIKPRLLGHWGTCHGINVAYANLEYFFGPTAAPAQNPQNAQNTQDAQNASAPQARQCAQGAPDPRGYTYQFILGPGHGFPALQANLFVDGVLAAVDPRATRNLSGLEYVCRNFSWPGGFPSHASPFTPGVVCEGGELGYALGAAYGLALGHPEKRIAVLLGDGELETASALASLNLVKLAGDPRYHGQVFPILHLNGYKISAPTLYGRKSPRELFELIRGFGYSPVLIDGDAPDTFQAALRRAVRLPHPFLILRTEKGAGGPKSLSGQKIAGNYLAHQIPLPAAKTDPDQLAALSDWLKSYHFSELFNPETGFTLNPTPPPPRQQTISNTLDVLAAGADL